MSSFFEDQGTRPQARDGMLGRWLRTSRQRRFDRSGFGSSTLQEIAWQRTRSAGLRWAIAGAIVGLLAGLVLFAPAAWLARAVERATDSRVLLTDVRGTVWNGDATAILSGGADSRTATSLPGRLQWTMRPSWNALTLRARQACCITGTLSVRVQPGFSRALVTVMPDNGSTDLGQWPAAWLVGLGTPWNTVQPEGVVRVSSPGFTIETVRGRSRFNGRASLDITGAASRLSTLPTLGSYQLNLQGDASTGGAANVNLNTSEGPLRLSGQGQWTESGLRFRGEARADGGQEDALNNLLNIIGRRQGAVSVISIG